MTVELNANKIPLIFMFYIIKQVREYTLQILYFMKFGFITEFRPFSKTKFKFLLIYFNNTSI